MRRVHKRQIKVEKACAELALLISEWAAKQDLTEAEYISILASVLSERINGVTKYQIRMERHGDHDTPGGWE